MSETLEDMKDHMRAQRSWLTGLNVDAMSGFQAAAVLEFGAKLERLGVAMQMLMAPKVDETFIWRQEGHRSAAGYLAEKIGATEGGALSVLETARQLGDLPETAACLRVGDFSAAQVSEIAAAATVHPGAEGELIEAAARSGLTGLRTRCRRTKALASFETDEVAREKAICKSRFLRHRIDPDGAVRIEARLTPADGARVLEAVKAKAGHFFDRAREAGLFESMAAYCADGLVSLADDAVCGPGTGIARPNVILRVDLDALRNGEKDTDHGVCEIPGVGPVSLATATALMTALEERDPVCAVDRCESDHLLENHHIVPFTDGGPTSLSNLVRICRWHHNLITYEGWRIEGRPGSWEWHPPLDFDGL